MGIRNIYAIDNESLVVANSPDGSLIGTSVRNHGDTPDGTVFTFGGGSVREVVIDDVRGGGRSKLNDDRPENHTVIEGKGLIDEGVGVEAESVILVRELNAQGRPTGPEIELYIYSQGGDADDIWGFGSNRELDPNVSYIKTGGSDNGTVFYRDMITCFAAGTLIKTARGATPVERIRLGQKVWTKGAGLQPVRWVGSTTVAGHGTLAPVRIEAGVLGNDRDLVVSQQHRVWIRNAAAELYFGHREVLVAAKHLCGLPGVALHPMDEVHYTHFMFDRHQIVRSNGALTESFFLADLSLSALDDGPRAELRALFPDLAHGMQDFGETAAPTLTAREAAALRPYLAA
ncbi:MAG: Hint domain-containing protein [Roseobacter sp.]|jgi:hypothetical protein|nr:Hint domain-containing protein [Roseobacter sp.]